MALKKSGSAAGNGKYHVLVSVVNGNINVDPDPVSVAGSDATIKWEMVTDGWTFPLWEDGIKLKRRHADFSNAASDASGKFFTMRNKNTVRKSHKYTIVVTNGRKSLALDPVIVNQT